MPGITVTSGRLPREKRIELMRELAATASRVTGIPLPMFTVYVSEFDDDCIAVGNETLAEIKARRAAAQK